MLLGDLLKLGHVEVGRPVRPAQLPDRRLRGRQDHLGRRGQRDPLPTDRGTAQRGGPDGGRTPRASPGRPRRLSSWTSGASPSGWVCTYIRRAGGSTSPGLRPRRPMVLCDARDRDSGKEVLIRLVEQPGGCTPPGVRLGGLSAGPSGDSDHQPDLRPVVGESSGRIPA
ncbi:hypothetical protein DCW30_15450 [Streptomyces alfalfae]|nr:hypothetical protein D3X13_30935 [Streptomyces fradiae]RXX43574.1 hypothetical protein DCW30_15450 [Streptomyces alfalfae]RZN01450.1 hypothetical protein D4104_07725 [Streptomyces alfalfae]